MKIVGVTACIAGIAHTYIAKEKLVNAAHALGHTISVETQGTIGTEDELTEKDIREADIVIISADISISGEERFAGKPVVKVPVSTVIKSPKSLIVRIQEKLSVRE